MAAAGRLQHRPYRDYALKGARWRWYGAIAGLVSLTACGTAAQRCIAPGGAAAEPIWVLTSGWHTEIGVPTRALRGPMAYFRTVYPASRVVLFGYGKRTFFTAKADDLSAYVLGPFPGRAVIQTMALTVPPDTAYGGDAVVTLSLKPEAVDDLTRAIWRDLVLDQNGRPHLTNTGNGLQSLFFAARSRYALTHSCNRWTCDMIHAAIPQLQPQGVIFSGQANGRLGAVLPPDCRREKRPSVAPDQGQGG